MTPGLLPEGIRDRLPPQAEAAVALTAVLMGVVGSHGYARVQPPLIEYEESLAGRLGAGSGRQAQRLRFVDPVTQRTLAVRSDITGQVGRIAATRLAHLPRPLRLGYAGPVLRVKGSQLTPERELLQAGAELIGSDTVAAALDVLGVAVEALAATGLTGLSIDLTLPDIVPTLASEIMPEDRIERLQALLDMKDAGALTAEGFGSWLPLLGVPGPVGEALPRLRAFDHAGLLATRLDGIAAVAAALGDRVRLTLDPTEPARLRISELARLLAVRRRRPRRGRARRQLPRHARHRGRGGGRLLALHRRAGRGWAGRDRAAAGRPALRHRARDCHPAARQWLDDGRRA